MPIATRGSLSAVRARLRTERPRAGIGELIGPDRDRGGGKDEEEEGCQCNSQSSGQTRIRRRHFRSRSRGEASLA